MIKEVRETRCYKVLVGSGFRYGENSYIHIITDDIAKIVKYIGSENIMELENLGIGKFL